MKTRTGFVSNSSSSSFIAYGVPVTRDELCDMARAQLEMIDAGVIINAIRSARWVPSDWKDGADKVNVGEMQYEELIDVLVDKDCITELFDYVLTGNVCDISTVGGITWFEEDLTESDTNILIGVMQDTDEYEISTMSSAIRALGVDADKLAAFCELSAKVGRDHDLFFGTRSN